MLTLPIPFKPGTVRYFQGTIDVTRYWDLSSLPPDKRPDKILCRYLFSPDLAYRYCSAQLQVDLDPLDYSPVWSDGREIDDDTREEIHSWLDDNAGTLDVEPHMIEAVVKTDSEWTILAVGAMFEDVAYQGEYPEVDEDGEPVTFHDVYEDALDDACANHLV